MSQALNPLFAAAVIDCVAEGRAPTVPELFSVAERIRRDAGTKPMFDWNVRPASPEEDYLFLRAAHAALCGTLDRQAARPSRPRPR